MDASSVYRIIAQIPRGEVASYGDVARALGAGVAPRLVGTVLGSNYDAAIPCHRVVAYDGSISGYNRGVQEKIRKLKKEGVKIKGRGLGARVVDFKRFRHSFASLKRG
ncbi:hypothetical protein A3C91_04065 [Candidatus Azambacteria bacterium RIFCSPHIGHO2_02_FULL_52_12]|uniref:Methylated-DNA-[protein]-cysteine S-methyltransferase DNA binding domain-containing protein n=1 Tax=Candidatus Azambacteria bacterium RIFCSPLOWO2_01_FULL_46_25 TaxID=1797298 RepID=A0A1F5BV09_9BACT|nr:MAG: hypothetical protein A3C91_04065 [Candidatus Azambacteria bacterium RIFCSPHIGHO2_02_FULL_52_12]OGD34421.1 MAG: hypothetical protein A2988_02750 [Candidatus Azambacteria bacterium RIFCSPLOWO2_01_FULL_46_25]OGD37301.1 MAG: hypothetical protein A2850_01140 [Candidatus Azambacteria bacterium RIFCSPHIGHO2_01_FULL_51_74]